MYTIVWVLAGVALLKGIIGIEDKGDLAIVRNVIDMTLESSSWKFFHLETFVVGHSDKALSSSFRVYIWLYLSFVHIAKSNIIFCWHISDENAEFVTFGKLNQWCYAGNGAARRILSVSLLKVTRDVTKLYVDDEPCACSMKKL